VLSFHHQTFLGPINSLAARVIENLAGNASTEVNSKLFIILSFGAYDNDVGCSCSQMYTAFLLILFSQHIPHETSFRLICFADYRATQS